MKTMKRMFAIVLSLMMALGMMTTAFADENPTITVPDNNHTYEVYQIFTGDLAGSVLSNIKWGENGTGTKGAKVDDAVIEALEGVKDKTVDAEKLDVIEQYVNLSSTPVATLTGDTLTYTGANGYYLIKDKDNTVSGNDVYTTYIVKVLGDTTIQPKGTVPEVDKEILDPDAMKQNEASIGEVVNYQITGTVPSNIADYDSYFYQFNDTLSKGLTVVEPENAPIVKITIDGKDATQYFYQSKTVNDDGTTTIKVTIADLKALSLLDDFNITAESKVVLTYSATLNENAIVGSEGNPNEVTLKYYNNPKDSGEPTTTPPTPPTEEPTTDKPTGTTPKDTVKTYTTELTIQKTDENGEPLQGAEFTLSGSGVGAKVVVKTETTFVEDAEGAYWQLKDGTYTTVAPHDDIEVDGKIVKSNKEYYADLEKKYSSTTSTTTSTTSGDPASVTAEVDETGKITFTGLAAGNDYVLKETKTPAGYNTIADITFSVSFADGKFTSTAPITVEADNTLYTEVVNKKGTELPETGGIGTTLFYTVGGMMVVAAGVLLITKKRMNA